MLTTDGRNQIKRYLAGYVPSIVSSVSFGIGTASENLLDKYLQFEVVRTNISLRTYNFANNKLIFKAPLPLALGATIYETGLYSNSADNVAAAYTSKLLTTFDSTKENWRELSNDAVSTYASSNARVGNDSLLHTPLGSATQTSYLRNLNYNFQYNTAADKFTFAFSVVNTNTSSVQFKFMTDASNYYSYTFGSGSVDSVGYKILTGTKAAAVVTGAPNWSKITEIQIVTTSKSAGQSDVEFDGIRIDNINDYGLDNLLVARKVLATPVVKVAGIPQDLEYSMDINI